MPEQLPPIQDMVEIIEKQYVGFQPNTTSVKPAHIANGMLRTVHGATYSTRLLNQFVFSETQKGKVPKGHELEAVYDQLIEQERVDEQYVQMQDIPTFRRLLKRVVGADSAVFEGSMASYSAGHQYFLTNDSIAQDGGELVAHCLSEGETHLIDYLRKTLQLEDDIVTLLCLPLLPDPSSDQEGKRITTGISADDAQSNVPDFFVTAVRQTSNNSLTRTGDMWLGLFEAANTLAVHLTHHPNKLFSLRLATLFACYVIARHLTTLEAYYVPDALDRVSPYLLDFSQSGGTSIAKASAQTYTKATQSVVRFYGWAFSEYLRERFNGNPAPLLQADPPLYKGRTANDAKVSKKAEKEFNEAKAIWEIARLRAQDEDDKFRVFGEAIYEMLSTQANAEATRYLGAIGLRAGILYPPNQANKRFVLKQDTLEMLVRGAVKPNETIDMAELQERFRHRYQLIIGGTTRDEEELEQFGVYQFDRDSLIENRKRFANALRKLDFAEMLADGVLQVRL